MKKNVYLTLTGMGLAAPYWFFIKFLSANGFDPALILQNLFANQITTFFALDLVISILVSWFFMIHEARRLGMKNWWFYIVASLTIGLSCALPLFLYFRERQLERQ